MNYKATHVSYEEPKEEPISIPRDCLMEFGEHDDHSDCERILDVMRGGYDYDISYDYPSYDPQHAHYERFGRPAFPNEY